MTQDNKRKTREKEFHDDYVKKENNVRQQQEIFYSKDIQKMEHNHVFEFFGDMHGKKLLFFGSGGHSSLLKEFIRRGAFVVAIDISPETIKQLNAKIEEDGLQNSCSAHVMDCEELTFDPSHFDIVFGRSIIHHLDIPICIQQINRVAKPNCKIAFIEPMDTNPIIRLYRTLTPDDRTPDEHPLIAKDLALFKQTYKKVDFKFLYFLTLFSNLIRKFTSNNTVFLRAFRTMTSLDNFFLKILPVYRHLCWDVIITAEKLSEE